LLLYNFNEVWLPLRDILRPILLIILVDHITDRCLGYLSRVLARCPLLPFQEAKEAFLLCVKVDVLTKLLVDLVPSLMLA
jgi:hypothetical protein